MAGVHYINHRGPFGQTCFFQACGSGRLADVKKMLANERCNPNICDVYGNTPLMMAVCYGHTQIVDLLLNDKRVIVTMRNKIKMSALDIANQQNRFDLMLKLLPFARILPSVDNNVLHIKCDPALRAELWSFISLSSDMKLMSFHTDFLFVTFSHADQAYKAKAILTEMQYFGPLKIGFANYPFKPHCFRFSQLYGPHYTLHVTHFPKNMLKHELEIIFATFPAFSHIEMGNSGKFAYAIFFTILDASYAMETLNQRSNLVVSYAKRPLGKPTATMLASASSDTLCDPHNV